MSSLMKRFASGQAGFSMVEIMLSVAIFGMVTTALIGAIIYARESIGANGSRNRATYLSQEGMEAVRSIRDRDYTLLADGTYGLALVGGQWTFSDTPDVTDGFRRQVEIAAQSETAKQVTVTITWQQTPQRTGTIEQAMNLTDWRPRHKAHGKVGAMLVYGDGGSTTDTIKYRILGKNGQWQNAYNTQDVDPTSSNRVLRAVRVYASHTKRREEVMISEHYNGTTEYIYAQVYNQYSSTWNQVTLLASWNTATFVNMESFSGSYLDNGDFMAVYSDGTTTPKFRVWNGSSWSAQGSLQTGAGVPQVIVASARPTTNEVMVAAFNANATTQTQYFNGGDYQKSSWTLHATHSSVADTGTEQLVDFAWSPNDATKGGLVFVNPNDTKSVALRAFTANGVGGGSWSNIAAAAAQSKNLSSVSIAGSDSQDTYIICAKDRAAAIICYTGDSTASIHKPANSNITGSTDDGTQRSFHTAVQTLFGLTGIIVYSDNSLLPKLKNYDITADAWDQTSQHLTAVGTSNKTTFNTTRLIPDDQSEDVMILMGVDNNDSIKNQQIQLYSAVWNGTDKAFYTGGPAGKVFQLQGAKGSAVDDYWYDFTWDPNFN